jgi:transcriptional regulator with XRE-family HTH domain
MPFRQPTDVDRVKQLLAKGLTQTQVHKRLGVSKNTVCLIANGKYQTPTRKDSQWLTHGW